RRGQRRGRSDPGGGAAGRGDGALAPLSQPGRRPRLLGRRFVLHRGPPTLRTLRSRLPSASPPPYCTVFPASGSLITQRGSVAEETTLSAIPTRGHGSLAGAPSLRDPSLRRGRDLHEALARARAAADCGLSARGRGG